MFSRFLRVAALLSALSSFIASATTIRLETLDQMAKRVPLIVRGRVARQFSGWDDQKRRIWTWTELLVSDPIKGKAPAVVLVKQPGGEADGIGQAVAGVAQFREGDDCVVFLERAPDEPGAFMVTGMAAGKITITDVGGKLTAVRDTSGLAFASPAKKKIEIVQTPEFLGAPDAFIARLRALGGAR